MNSRTWVVSLLACLMAGSAIAQGQGRVRVIAETAEIRLQADPNSPVLSTVPAGSLLELVGQDGAWLAIAIPRRQGSVDPERVGYLSAAQAERFAGTLTTQALDSAGQVSQRPQGRALGAPGQPSQDALQLQMDQARRRRSSGKKKFWLGIALGGAGAVMASTGSGLGCDNYGCYTSSTELATIGAYTMLAGGVLDLWGLVQWISASGEVADLAAQGAIRSSNNSRRPLSPPQLAYSWRW